MQQPLIPQTNVHAVAKHFKLSYVTVKQVIKRFVTRGCQIKSHRHLADCKKLPNTQQLIEFIRSTQRLQLMSGMSLVKRCIYIQENARINVKPWRL